MSIAARDPKCPARSTPLLLAACGLLVLPVTAANYDPLQVPETPAPKPLDLTATDAKRAREIPLRVYLPAATAPAPVVLFSHGLGGSREGSSFLGQHWAARGYVAVFLQHPGSDEAIWKGQATGQHASAMRRAATAE
ncbi:MAG: hypothetical protein RLZZ522_1158, partial [Verrucomicrobiota bacterium]